MDVGLGHVRDPHLRSLGRAKVLVGVSVRIEHERFARHLATDQIARLRELLVVETFLADVIKASPVPIRRKIRMARV